MVTEAQATSRVARAEPFSRFLSAGEVDVCLAWFVVEQLLSLGQFGSKSVIPSCYKHAHRVVSFQ